MEILMKLRKEGLELVTTSDGMDFFTPLYLKKSMNSFIDRVGKIQVVELASQMNFGIEVIEKYVN